jgi:hypothetical protein
MKIHNPFCSNLIKIGVLKLKIEMYISSIKLKKYNISIPEVERIQYIIHSDNFFYGTSISDSYKRVQIGENIHDGSNSQYSKVSKDTTRKCRKGKEDLYLGYTVPAHCTIL